MPKLFIFNSQKTVYWLQATFLNNNLLLKYVKHPMLRGDVYNVILAVVKITFYYFSKNKK